MTWAAIGVSAVGVVGGAMMNSGGDKNGGAGTQTVDKSPWAPIQPWILDNAKKGQAMQEQYAAQPFSPQQTAAYGNSFAQGDYMRALVPSLLGQMQNQQVGFDPNNPNARPSAWNWNALGEGGAGGAGGAGGPNMNQQSVANAVAPPAPPAAPEEKGKFTQYTPNLFDPSGYNMGDMLGARQGSTLGPLPPASALDQVRSQFMGTTGGAGYGDFKYGQTAPERGTQAYRDMQEYMSYGGFDPYGLYGEKR